MDRMYCYLWYEKSNPNECKFGERWVKKGQDPLKEIWKRIDDSIGVRGDLIKDGSIELAAYWDVSQLAISECPNRHKPKGRVDDYIRGKIGFRKGTTGEIHTLNANEMAIKVNELLIRSGQPLPSVGLSQNQYDAAVNVLSAVKENKRTVVAELCARFGKTIWGGVLAREQEVEITIVASYVLTSFASFKKDLSSFEQFREFTLVDTDTNTDDDNWKSKIQSALDAQKQVIVFLSMCGGSKRQSKIDFLFNLKVSRLLLVDEADFGVHKLSQSEPLRDARKPDDIVILMTGTNGDKAASVWPVDHYLSVTYPELIIEKRITEGKLNPSANQEHGRA